MFENESKKRVLVVDDEQMVRESLRMILERFYDVDVASNSQQAIEVLSNREDDNTNLVLLDVMMPGLDGIGLLKKIRVDYPSLPVIMLSASTAVRTAVQAIKIGAVDYLNKPYDVDELLSLINETLVEGGIGKTEPNKIKTVAHSREEQAEVEGDFGEIVGQDQKIQELYKKIEQISGTEATVLIAGESGTGKEIVAREIHKRSSRTSKNFTVINCAAIPNELVESVLFGHEKGAFTHANESRVGLFEQADGGTLFLDEIGDLSLEVQMKILRFLQDKELSRVGSNSPIKLDLRILAASNRNLEKLLEEKKFREDLYYRINVVRLDVPPLRERSSDIKRLFNHFLEKMKTIYGVKELKIEDSVYAVFNDYQWPGNVRELENIAESIVALNSKGKVEVADLPKRFRGDLETDCSLDSKDILPFEEAERRFETEIILKALKKSNYVQTKAAEMLGISRRILKYKMDKLKIKSD